MKRRIELPIDEISITFINSIEKNYLVCKLSFLNGNIDYFIKCSNPSISQGYLTITIDPHKEITVYEEFDQIDEITLEEFKEIFKVEE